MTPGELQQLQAIRWFHSINLGDGIVTPGLDSSSTKLRTLGLPDDLSGLTVLDIGAWDGFFSFEAERRGASRVLATDKWDGQEWGAKAGFNFAKKALHSKVEDLQTDVLGLSAEKVGQFDLVLFLGVLYHLRHPLLALEKVFSVTKRHLIIETLVDMKGSYQPMMVFYPQGTLGDSSNYWGPNPAAVEAMLRFVGFTKVERVYSRSWLYSLAKAFRCQFEKRTPFLQVLRQGRVVFHAWR